MTGGWSCGSENKRAGLSMRHVLWVMVLVHWLVVARAADPMVTYDDCGDVFTNAYGPFDYNDAESRATGFEIVERVHFTTDVETLTSGATGNLMADLDYTLRAVPNHHRALNAMARYDLEKGSIRAPWRSAKCYFQRATVFRPEDGMVWLIYGNYQARKKMYEEARQSYERARQYMPGSIEVDYNLGLLYLKLGEYDKALAHAKLAYAGNYPLQGLRRQLAGKGYDVDE